MHENRTAVRRRNDERQSRIAAEADPLRDADDNAAELLIGRRNDDALRLLAETVLRALDELARLAWEEQR